MTACADALRLPPPLPRRPRAKLFSHHRLLWLPCHGLGKCQRLIYLDCLNGCEDGRIEARVWVYEDIAKSEHAQHTPEHSCIDDACLGKQHKALSRLFGGPQAAEAHDPIGDVDARL